MRGCQKLETREAANKRESSRKSDRVKGESAGLSGRTGEKLNGNGAVIMKGDQ